MTEKKKEEVKKVEPITMRTPFADNQINALPRRPFFIDKDTWKKEKKSRCKVCGGWHPDKAIHLDYVGHAAMTDRLLDVDPNWNWEPFAVDASGLPAFSNNGLWIKLTVLGVTRNGFGDAQGKTGGDAIKEVIGDAIRNAAMRFGGALDLWHKGDLHEALADEGNDAEDDTVRDKFINTDQKKVLLSLIKETDTDVKAYLKNIEFTNIDEITVDKFDIAKGKLEHKKKQMVKPEINEDQA